MRVQTRKNLARPCRVALSRAHGATIEKKTSLLRSEPPLALAALIRNHSAAQLCYAAHNLGKSPHRAFTVAVQQRGPLERPAGRVEDGIPTLNARYHVSCPSKILPTARIDRSSANLSRC